jgi:alkanesulfonate monooxygenase SsuD/methylene tetrahydromethanopterin reductase-like flavin-dependent oxidoreductase (luciferase family)
VTQIRVGIHAEDAMFVGPLAQRRALLERARRGGLDHVFVADHVSFHTGFGMDGLVRAATIAAQEPELAVHIGVYLLALRHPVPVARAIATLCESAPGRLVLGVGVGGEDRHEIEICNVDPKTRGRRTDDSLAALRALLSGVPASYACEFFSFENAWIRPAPDPPVPIVVGGRSGAALRRAGRLGDGWLGVWCSPKRFAEARAEVEAHGVGRTATWRHGLQVWVGLGSDRESERGAARDRLSHAMQGVYRIPFERFEKYCPYGSPAEIADFLVPYVAAGARDFNVMAVSGSAEQAIDGVAEIRARLTQSA